MKPSLKMRTLSLSLLLVALANNSFAQTHFEPIPRPNFVSASINNPIAEEGFPLFFTISLSSAPNTPRSLLFSTDQVGLGGCGTEGTSNQAGNGSFVGKTQTVNFAVGQTQAVVAVVTCPNRINGVNGEDLYSVYAHISLPSAKLTILDGESLGFIFENDHFPPAHP